MNEVYNVQNRERLQISNWRKHVRLAFFPNISLVSLYITILRNLFPKHLLIDFQRSRFFLFVFVFYFVYVFLFLVSSLSLSNFLLRFYASYYYVTKIFSKLLFLSFFLLYSFYLFLAFHSLTVITWIRLKKREGIITGISLLRDAIQSMYTAKHLTS